MLGRQFYQYSLVSNLQLLAEQHIAGNQRRGGDCIAEYLGALVLRGAKLTLFNVENAALPEKNMHTFVQQCESAAVRGQLACSPTAKFQKFDPNNSKTEFWRHLITEKAKKTIDRICLSALTQEALLRDHFESTHYGGVCRWRVLRSTA